MLLPLTENRRTSDPCEVFRGGNGLSVGSTPYIDLTRWAQQAIACPSPELSGRNVKAAIQAALDQNPRCLTELLPWPCPLTLLEKLARTQDRDRASTRPFLLHYLDRLMYPNISPILLTIAAVIICVLNLAFYARQMWSYRCARGWVCKLY